MSGQEIQNQIIVTFDASVQYASNGTLDSPTATSIAYHISEPRTEHTLAENAVVLDHVENNNRAEARAMLRSVRDATRIISQSDTVIHLKGDARNVIDAVRLDKKSTFDDTVIQNMIDETKELLDDFHTIHVDCITGQENLYAHNLAQEAF